MCYINVRFTYFYLLFSVIMNYTVSLLSLSSDWSSLSVLTHVVQCCGSWPSVVLLCSLVCCCGCWHTLVLGSTAWHSSSSVNLVTLCSLPASNTVSLPSHACWLALFRLDQSFNKFYSCKLKLNGICTENYCIRNAALCQWMSHLTTVRNVRKFQF